MLAEMLKTDNQIQQEVLQELKFHPNVDPAEVGVQVTNGLVTLTGSVDSYAKKIAAKESAHKVAGVLDVVNDLVVVLPQFHVRNDQDIAVAARNALQWDVDVPDERIHCTVNQGLITLEGEVDSWPQYKNAERCIERLTGVRGVINKIEVRPKARIEPLKLRRMIEDALSRQAHREAERIDVKVDGGALTLTGTVRSWAEKNAVYNIASHAPGVERVIDRMVIDSFS